MTALARGERERLPCRRRHVTYALRVDGHKIHVSVGTRRDGTVREFFLDLAHREGAPLRAIAHIVAASNSLALQHGAPLKAVCGALRVAAFAPAGEVTGHPLITHATSLFDLVAQVLEHEAARPRGR